ncbi:elongation factor 1-alpha C-terminal domain-related protein [Nocardia noduli]|uniref:elongation factor 1-alpha C-terminal domain-related protein n=1 Tax=Nocardia noduli TaxID=2815722 RepID=UPI001C24B859
MAIPKRHNQVRTCELDAIVCWFGATPLRAGARLSLEHTTSTRPGDPPGTALTTRSGNLDEHDRSTELALNDIGSITLRLSPIVIADKYTENRDAGAFILINELSNARFSIENVGFPWGWVE